MEKSYITIAEASKRLGVSASTLRRLEKNGQVEGYGINVYFTPGGQRRYLYDEVKHAYKKWGQFGQIGFGNKPCIIVRDLIRYFTDPTSKMGYDLSEVIVQTRALLSAATEFRIPVVFSITVYEPTNRISNMWAQKIETNLLLKEESVWTEMDPSLSDYDYAKVARSPYISPYFKSDLDDWLQAEGIDTVIVAGNSTSGCVRITAIDSLQHGFHTIVAKDAVGDRSNIEHNTALFELNAKYADVVSVEEITHYFKQIHQSEAAEI